MTAPRLAIGVDIGGSKTAVGVVDEEGRVLARRQAETRGSDPQAVLRTVAELVAQLRREHDVVALGVGAAGFVAADGSTVLFAPHLAWRGEPLRDAVERRTGMPARLENDANAAAWAEWRFGVAVGQPDGVFVALGTGIGGAVVLGGEPHRGRFGLAGEFGHMQVVPDGLPCECGNTGCWEQYASGRVLTRWGRDAVTAGTVLGRRLLAGAGSVDDVHGTHVTAAALAGDEEATGWFTDVGTWLGVGLANLAAALDPGVVVVGGGLSEAGELLLGPARTAFARSLTGRGHRPEPDIVGARFGPDAGLVGAADLARRRTGAG